jgi:osmotically-inducible protein OsmY
MRSDFDVQADVLAALATLEHLVVSDIGVAVRDGVVTLTGVTDSLMKRVGAERLVEAVVGVRGVANEIVVRLPGDHWRTDTEIANDAVNALIRDTEVPDKTVKVRVHDRWIWLLGEVAWNHQRVAAQRAVELVAGAKGVTNLIAMGRQPVAPDAASRIQAELRSNHSLADCSVHVAVDGARAHLSGSVRCIAERAAAERAAWSVLGISHVDNGIEVAA